MRWDTSENGAHLFLRFYDFCGILYKILSSVPNKNVRKLAENERAEAMKDLLERIVLALIDHPEQLEISEVESARAWY